LKTLVTGATGLIGSHLIRALLRRGDDVRILRRRDSRLDLLGGAADEVEHAVGDVTDPDSVFPALAGVDVVFHAAGAVGLNARRDKARLHNVNAQGTANVVNAALAAGVRRFVHTSSIAAIGRPDVTHAVIDENAEWVESRRNSEYARSKHKAEMEVHRGVAEGLDAVVVNPSLVFGAGRDGENTVRILESIRSGRLPGVPVGGTNVVDVEDVVAGHLLALDRGERGARYILGSENLTWRSIVDTISESLGVSPTRRTINPRLSLFIGHAFDAMSLLPGVRPLITAEIARQSAATFKYDNARARSELGCTFRPFAETISRVVRELYSGLRSNHSIT